MKTKRILFINAINAMREVESRYPSLAFGYLISSLQKEFPGVFEYKIADRDIEHALEDFRPDIVCISSVTQNFMRALVRDRRRTGI